MYVSLFGFLFENFKFKLYIFVWSVLFFGYKSFRNKVLLLVSHHLFVLHAFDVIQFISFSHGSSHHSLNSFVNSF